jgi:hypothetical protein
MNGIYEFRHTVNGAEFRGTLAADDSTIERVIANGQYANGVPGLPSKEHFRLLTTDTSAILEFDRLGLAHGANPLGNYISLAR